MALWTPAEITTALWLDAADSSTVTESGGAVSQWADKSGEDRHVTQATGSLQPVYTSESHLAFDGVDDYLSAGSNYLYSDSTHTGVTVFAVANSLSADSETGYDFVFDFGEFSPSGYGLSFARNALCGYTPNLVRTVNVGVTDSGYRILCLRIEFGSTQKLFFDAVEQDSASISIPQLSSTQIDESSTRQSASGPVCVGRLSKTTLDSGRALHGNLRELLVVRDAVSESDRQIIEGYLAHKWGLESSLPSGHPYETSAPLAPAIVTLAATTADDSAAIAITHIPLISAEIAATTGADSAAISITHTPIYNAVIAATTDDDIASIAAIALSTGVMFRFADPIGSVDPLILSWSDSGQLLSDRSQILATHYEQLIGARHIAQWVIDEYHRQRSDHIAQWVIDEYHRQRSDHIAQWVIDEYHRQRSDHIAQWKASLSARNITSWQFAQAAKSSHTSMWGGSSVVAATHGSAWRAAQAVSAAHLSRWVFSKSTASHHGVEWSSGVPVVSHFCSAWAGTLPTSGLHTALWSDDDRHCVRSQHTSPWSVISSAVRVLNQSPILTHNGVDQSPLAVTLSHDNGDTAWSASITLGTVEDWLPLCIGDDVTLTVGSVSYALVIDQLGVDRISDTYSIKALSPVARYGAPWVSPAPLREVGLARSVCERLLDQSIDWWLTDWLLPNSASALDATPLELAVNIAKAVGGVIESNPDGSLRARPLDPYGPPSYQASTIAASLTDDDIVSRVDSVGSSSSSNSYTVTSGDDGTVDAVQIESVDHPDEPNNAYIREVRAYPHPYRAIDLAHTGDASVSIGSAVDNTTEHDELVTIEAGVGRTRYPVHAVISTSYQYADLGAITTSGKELRAAVESYSQIQIRYTSSCRRWRVEDARDETIQFLAMEPS